MKPSEKQVDAMDAIFNFAEAMTQGELTMIDLVNVMEFAIDDGHEMLQIQLAMASIALEKVVERKKSGVTTPFDPLH